MIGITGLGFYFIGMVSNLVINVYLKILSFTTVGDSCGYLWNPVNCLAFRLPVYYAFVGFNVFHIMLSLERARITFIRYNTEDLLFGQIGVILMVILTRTYQTNTSVRSPGPVYSVDVLGKRFFKHPTLLFFE